jgi:hypothetical protein
MADGLSFGIWTLVGAALGPVVAVIGFGARRFIAYMDGKEERPRPLKAWCIMLAITGAVAGSLWQSTGYSECRDAGYKVIECLIPLGSPRT